MPDLSKWQDDFSSAPTEREGGSRTEVPDGNHQAQIARVELKESKAGDPMLEFELDLLGKYAGRKLWRKSMLTKADNIKYLKADLYTCGLTLTNINDLNNQDVLGKLIGVTLEITKKTKGDYANVYFNKRITVNIPMASAPRRPSTPVSSEPPSWATEEVPF